MGITYYEKERIFKLDTKTMSYIMAVVDEEGFLGHVYFGKRVEEHDLSYLTRTNEFPYVPSKNNRDRLVFNDTFPTEFSSHGAGDFRESSICVRTKEGHSMVRPVYKEHTIYEGKKKLEGLPATFGTQETSTLEITLTDRDLNLDIILSYSIFDELDIVARSVRVFNNSKDDIYLTKIMSTCLDMDNREFDMITLHGSWARERHIQRKALGYGIQGLGSVRGESSHQNNPFMALVTKNCTQEQGEAYGFHFVYSGNFIAQAEVSQHDSVRLVMGIHPQDFYWKLAKGEAFQAPEVIMVYSSEGIGNMTRQFHDLYRNHLIRSPYKDKKRPILINNWEATYFDFDTNKLLSIAKEASSLGIEMLVMDDGWFGRRNSDNCSLGDWEVNEEKLSGGLQNLVNEVNKLGMKFGIWFEPEMISPDSELYRSHPDWAIAVPGRVPIQSREQYVLDLSRREVIDHIYNKVAAVLHSANIEYVKWDMNRHLTDLGSYKLSAEQMGELYHRYMLGVYELQERLVTEFPNLLLENCSGGGARFDPGMLYYSPQIWCSDDADAIERLNIQEGTALVYPLSTIGAHVSDCPNHTVGRVTPFETRGYVALAGTFGYELDVTRIPEEDRKMIPNQVAMYHKYNNLVREGDYYRLASYRENHLFDCYMVVSKDKREALVTFIQVMNRANSKSRNIRLKGLKADCYYMEEETGRKWLGSTLMNAGIMIENLWGDYKGKLIHFIEL